MFPFLIFSLKILCGHGVNGHPGNKNGFGENLEEAPVNVGEKNSYFQWAKNGLGENPEDPTFNVGEKHICSYRYHANTYFAYEILHRSEPSPATC